MVILPWWSVTRTASLERARKASSTPGAPAAPVPIFAVSGGDGGGGEARLIGRRYTGLDAWSGHSSSVPLFLRGAWAHRGAFFLADPERPLAAADHGRDGPVQAVLPRPAGAAVPAGGQRPEVVPDHRHRERRADDPAHDVLRDAGELLLRRLLQGRRYRPGLGARHRAVRARPRAAVGHGLRGGRRSREAVARVPPGRA